METSNTTPAGNARPGYEAVILNVTKGKYVGATLKSGKISHVKNWEDAVLFWDEYEANAELERLNDVMADCYAIVETKQPPAGNDLPQQNILFEATDRAYKFLSAMGHFTTPTNEGRIVENLLIQARVTAATDFPALQEQNKELLEALKEAKTVIYNLGNGLERRNPVELQAIFDTLITKYSK